MTKSIKYTEIIVFTVQYLLSSTSISRFYTGNKYRGFGFAAASLKISMLDAICRHLFGMTMNAWNYIEF